MPYYNRRYANQNRNYRRRRYNRRAYRPRQTEMQKVASTAYSAYKYGRIAMSLLNSEKKFYDVSSSVTPVLSTWQSLIVNQVPQGDTDNTRDGNKIRIKSCQTKIFIKTVNQTTTADAMVRMVLVQCLTSSLVPTDVFPAGINTLRNKDYTNQYKVLWDVTRRVSNSNNATAEVEKFVKLDLPVSYIGATTNLEKDGLMLLWTVDGAFAVSTEEPLVNIQNRIRYMDN